MKLYSLNLSPFASRPRVAVYAKSLPVSILPPPGGTRSPDYLAINPMGKAPALVLNDGTVIPESETILEYLADAFPVANLRPFKAEDAARARVLSRICELYVMTPGGALFGQLNPANRDATVVDTALTNIDKGLGHLDHFLKDDKLAVGDSITTADCTLTPSLFVLSALAPAFGKADIFAGHRKLAAYWSNLQNDPGAGRVIAEMGAALKAFQTDGTVS